MIKKLNITNFKSHKSTAIEFDPNVNIFIGETDSGKSALLKALRLLFQNKPSGFNYRTHNTKGEVEVAAEFEDHIIKRYRTNSKNQYHLDDQVFDAVSKTIPEEISTILNVSDINIQRQLDSPFFLSMSGGEMARYMNDVVNLEDVDKANKNINRSVRESESHLSFLRSSIGDDEAEMKELRWVRKAKRSVDKLDSMRNEMDDLEDEIEDLASLIRNNRILRKKIKKQKRITRVESKLKELEERNKKIKTHLNFSTSLKRHVLCFEDQMNELKEQKKLLKHSGKMKEILQIDSDRQALRSDASEIEKAISSANDLAEALERQNKEILAMEKEFKEKMPKICPLCGSNRRKK